MTRYRPAAGAGRGPTVLAYPLGDLLIIFGGIPALGLLLGLLVPPFARWLIGLSIPLPMRALLRLLAAANEPWEIAIGLGAGLVLGLGVALVAMTDATKVTLTDAELRLDRDGPSRTIARGDIDAVFLDGKRLVVLDRESRLLVSEAHQAPAGALASAFRAHGYPWCEADPHADRYRRWIPDTPDLPLAVNALLAAREVALEKKSGKDILDLRDAVESLGFTVRDEDARQYWRPLVR